MTRRNPPARWVLPAIVNPPSRRCLSIEIPNERYHIAAFRGALLNLASALSWQDDMAHTAKEVALVWRDIVDNVTDCLECNFGIDTGDDDMQLRIKPGDDCIIQTLCGDGTWLDWYDPRGCIPGSIAQPGPTPQPDVGECFEYDVVLPANSMWHLPVPVSSNDTIEITQVSGGWNDGTALWFCPDGQDYVLGACIGGGATDAGDPLPTENHMRLIGTFDGVYYDAYDTTITVPTGLAQQDMWFQPNDDTLNDNSGSISFHVKYCHNAETPVDDCLAPDFTVNNGGWANVGSVADFGTYISTGTKHWESDYHDATAPNTYQQLRIFHAYTGHIASVRARFDAAQPGYMAFYTSETWPEGVTPPFVISFGIGDNQIITIPLDTDAASVVRFDLSHDVDANTEKFKLYELEICP